MMYKVEASKGELKGEGLSMVNYILRTVVV